ncbi:MAG: hypothetical protein JW700_04035 [Candidatus Aenigmarchaeota archaeon]|nr:hypothetical protein [Candidatus Aenigmarchaeota archaeon]
MKFDLLKNWRILIMIFAVLLSILLIDPFPKSGVLITSVSKESPFYGTVQAGEYITWANEREIRTPDDFYIFEGFVGSFRLIHDGDLSIVGFEQGDELGIVVEKPASTNLQFGLDLVGGTRVLLRPMENVSNAEMQQIVGTLETRINVFGLKEAKFQTINDVSGEKYVQIEMAGGSKAEVENLLAKQGKFEGKVPRNIIFTNNSGELELDTIHTINLVGDSIRVDGETLQVNDTSVMDGVNYKVLNITDEGAVLMFTIFTGADIQSVCLQDQQGICVSRVIQQSGGWEFNFQVFVTEESAEKFAKITKTMKVLTNTGGSSYLENNIYLFLDDGIITDLGISSDLKGKTLTSPAITGFRPTRIEAYEEQLMLKSILQSGALPVTLETIKIDEISANLGSEFFREALVAGIIAVTAVMTIIFIRYRNFKIMGQMLVWSACELIITLGTAALFKWTIDLSSIAGLIAAIGTGTNDQVIMIDEILTGGGTKDNYTVSQRIKRSFFIVFSAAGTIIAAMVPLMFIGIGSMKGFAIITTMGVLIGVFITRPPFATVAEKILVKEE